MILPDYSNPWGMDKDECEWLTKFCVDHNVGSVIEFGPGNSTMALLASGIHILDSYEQSEERVAELEEYFKHEESIIINHFPHTWDKPLINSDFCYDLALIDGPTGSSVYPPRINSASICYGHCKYMVFHDSKRDAVTVDIIKSKGMVEVDRFNSERGLIALTHG